MKTIEQVKKYINKQLKKSKSAWSTANDDHDNNMEFRFAGMIDQCHSILQYINSGNKKNAKDD